MTTCNITKAQWADLKRYVLTSELDKDLRHLTLNRYNAIKMEDSDLFFKAESEIASFKEQCGEPLYKAIESINNTRYHRIKKVKEKINDIVSSGRAIFLTITFSPHTMDITSEDTRRRYVSRFLKETCYCYVANQDFGEKNDREHYHAVVYGKNGSVNLKKWIYGRIDAERVRNTKNDLGALARYVTKLTNHAVKDSASTKRLIYSRKNSEFRKKVKDDIKRINVRAFIADLMAAGNEPSDEELIKQIF